MTLELRNRGFVVNHKKAQHLMKVLGLTARIRRKRKYSSYQGDVGKKADNLIQRQFEATKLMQKCYTDVTKFAIPASRLKLYLSPVLDGFNSEIISYNLSTSPNLVQMKAMLEQAFTENHYENTILHSDQGGQYQHDFYHHFLKNKGIQPSMSRKGNSPDNGMMESFFGNQSPSSTTYCFRTFSSSLGTWIPCYGLGNITWWTYRTCLEPCS